MWALLLLLLVAIAFWGWAGYRRLAGMRRELLARWTAIDRLLRTRHNLVSNLINVLPIAMVFEREALMTIVQARESAVGVAGPADAARREDDLSHALDALFAAAARYPSVDTNKDLISLRQELTSLGRKIRAAQQLYNDTAGRYNAARRLFPLSMLARQLGLRPAEGFDAATLAGVILAIALSATIEAQPPVRLRGFSPAGAAAEATLEQVFKRSLSPKDASADFDVLTAQPHHVGSAYAIQLADVVADRFKDAGLVVARYEYGALIPWPIERRVDIVAPDTMPLSVDEEALSQDPYAGRQGILPAYNAYSPSGDVTGQVVYVNYGLPADYEVLAKAGVSMVGKIALARYGASWRGIKQKVAAEHGAIGCLIYSDPRDDGYFQGDAYPDGPFRGLGMIQRGSVMDLPRRPGDPSTPSGPSIAGTPRVPLEQLDTLAKIPTQPLSGRTAIELLRRMDGDVVPEAWRGALPVTYHFGGGMLRVHLKLQMDYAERRVIDVIGTIPGARFPDEWIILGSHRDAWVFGAADPESGQTAVINVARSLGKLLKEGWRPSRTISIASWDGEEPGLIGSTEWVEQFSNDLVQKAAAYINLDPGATGPFVSTGATHSLAPFIREVAESVESDLPGKSLYARWSDHVKADTSGPPPPLVGALGSGSDYTPFLDHLGVASLDIGLRGTRDFGAYHSLYDDPAWFKRFIDPDFSLNVRASQASGVAVLRLANADVLPFDYAAYGEQVLEYLDELEQLAKRRWPATADTLRFGELKASVRDLMKAGTDAAAEAERLTKGAIDQPALSRLNHRLIMAERDLTDPAGLPDRPWYKHLIYAPGLYTGYAVKTIPGVREALEAGDFTRALEQSQTLLRAIQRATRTLSL